MKQIEIPVKFRRKTVQCAGCGRFLPADLAWSSQGDFFCAPDCRWDEFFIRKLIKNSKKR